jgi:hypothetical protein
MRLNPRPDAAGVMRPPFTGAQPSFESDGKNFSM